MFRDLDQKTVEGTDRGRLRVACSWKRGRDENRGLNIIRLHHAQTHWVVQWVSSTEVVHVPISKVSIDTKKAGKRKSSQIYSYGK